jgi:hypothetical protein
LETVFSIQSMQSGYKKENLGSQFSWAPQGKLRKDGDLIQLRVESPTVKKRVSCKSAVVKSKLYVCCSYSETVIIIVLKSAAGIQLVKTENT